jgi:hypothetical protein
LSRPFTVLGAATALLVAAAVNRARTRAEEEGRPLPDVLRELVTRLPQDVSTIPEDARRAIEEGKIAAAQREAEVDEDLRRAREALGKTRTGAAPAASTPPAPPA